MNVFGYELTVNEVKQLIKDCEEFLEEKEIVSQRQYYCINEINYLMVESSKTNMRFWVKDHPQDAVTLDTVYLKQLKMFIDSFLRTIE